MEPQDTNADVNKPEVAPDAPLSRRDFLRHAGKEAGKAAQTGVKLVPGAALAQTVLGVGKDETEGGAGQIVGNSPAWWRRLVMWRSERTQGGGGG